MMSICAKFAHAAKPMFIIRTLLYIYNKVQNLHSFNMAHIQLGMCAILIIRDFRIFFLNAKVPFWNTCPNIMQKTHITHWVSSILERAGSRCRKFCDSWLCDFLPLSANSERVDSIWDEILADSFSWRFYNAGFGQRFFVGCEQALMRLGGVMSAFAGGCVLKCSWMFLNVSWDNITY